MIFLRYVAEHLSPLSRTLFRTVHADLMDSVLPSNSIASIASPALHHHLLKWRHHIRELTILIESGDTEEIIHVIPSLEYLTVLDIRSTVGTLDLWMLQYLVNLETCHAVATVVKIPRCLFPKLKTLRIVSGSESCVYIDQRTMPSLESLVIRTHKLTTGYCDLPKGLEHVTVSAHLLPTPFIESLYGGVSIKHLSFEWCRMTYLPHEFGRLEQLESLSMRGNFLTIFNEYGERDGCMLPISRLQNLRYLDLSDNVCLEMQSPSIQLPENIETLDVRGMCDSYYHEPFFDGGHLDGVQTLYTSKLPSKETIRNTFQNLRTIVYAPPEPMKNAFQTMIDLYRLDKSPRDMDTAPRIMGVRIPVETDDLALYLDGAMNPDDCIRYKEL